MSTPLALLNTTRSSARILGGFFLAFLLSSASLFAQRIAALPQVQPPVHFDVSGELRNVVPVQRPVHVPVAKPVLPRPGRKASGVLDPSLQVSVGPDVAATIAGVNRDGIGVNFFGPQGGFFVDSAPSDSNGAVGKLQFVEVVNSDFAVFNKQTGAVSYGPAPISTLWFSFGGPCEHDNDGDPTVTYDKIANRWVVAQFAVTDGGNTGPFLYCLAVSTTADALGPYARYAYAFPNFPDYPKLGLWPDGYYASFNMFTPDLTGYVGAEACAFDRVKMLAGQPANSVCFLLTSSYYSLLPSDLDGYNPPPPGAPNYFLSDDLSIFQLDLFKFHADFVTPTNSTISFPQAIPITPYVPACGPTSVDGVCVPQQGTTQLLDTLGNRLMYRLSYRNFGDHESLFASETVNDAPTGIRWYELRSPGATPVLYQQSTYLPDSTYRFMPSIASDRKGNLALGYSVSSAAIHPGIRYTGRVPTDPLNTMESENTIISGTGSQIGGLSRWGDYSSMSVDPVDDCTMWYTNQYLVSTNLFNWHTRFANLRFPSCNTAPTIIGVVPNAGTAVTQTFQADYGDPDGGTDLNLVYLVFNSTPSVVNACAAVYDRPDNLLYLFNDAGNGFVPGALTPGGAGSLSNSQCTLNAAGSSVIVGPFDLKVNFNITFKPSFVGLKNIYMLDSDLGGQVDAGGFTLVGTFTGGVNMPPTADSVAPNSGTATTRTYTFTYSDPNSYHDLAVVYALFNSTLVSPNGCFIAYNQAINGIYLLNDAGTALVPGSITPGTAGTLSNTQCTVASGGPVTGSGNSLTVPLTVTLTAAFNGLKNIYGVAADFGGLNSGYTLLGTTSRVNAVPGTPTVAPNTGSGASQLFTMSFSDADGYADLNVGVMAINPTFSLANGCVVVYFRAANVLSLLDNTGTMSAGTVTPGSAGSVNNSQCTMTSGGAVTAAGTTLTVPVNLAFNHATFAGAKSIYMVGIDSTGANGGYQLTGMWTVP